MAPELPEQLLESLPDAVLILNDEGVAEHVNAEAAKWFGPDLVGKQVGVPLTDFAVVRVPGRDRIRAGELRVADAPEFGAGRRAAVIRDVTDREDMKEQLTRQVVELGRLVEFLTIMPSPVVRVNRDGEVLWRNDAFNRVFGSASSLVEALPVNGQHDKLGELLEAPADKTVRSVVFEPDSPDGLPLIAHAVLLEGTPDTTTTPRAAQEVGVVLDMYADQDRIVGEYLDLLYFDPDLHLPNLRGLQFELRSTWESDTVSHLVIVLVDWSVLEAHGGTLDTFSRTRSRHLADQIALLQEGMLREFALSAITVARSSFNSFAIVLTGLPGTFDRLDAGAESLMTRLRGLAGQPTLTAGMVASRGIDGTLADHVEAATVAAEVAHETGLMLKTFSQADSDHLRDQQDMHRRVRKAIQDRAFTVVFQPRISTGDLRLVSVEVLARWHDPVLGDVPPSVFVPLLKRLGLVSELTAIVFEKSLSELTSWRERGLTAPKLSLNVVSQDLVSPAFLDSLQRVAYQVGQRGAIELELAETDAFPTELGSELHAILDTLGIELSLDDFGTGYSTFGYLVSLPIACIKIDKMFVDQLLIPEKQPATRALIRAIVAMARELRITICAEGAETEEQVLELTLLGVDEIQGFVFSKPLSADELERTYLS